MKKHFTRLCLLLALTLALGLAATLGVAAKTITASPESTADSTAESAPAEEAPATNTDPASALPLSGKDTRGQAEMGKSLWYRFDLAEAGGIMFFIQSRQDPWNGYSTVWTAKVYAADGESPLKSASIRGAWHLTAFTVGDLQPGTYYVKVTAQKTSDPFDISAVALCPSAIPQYTDDTAPVVSEGKTVIAASRGVYFVKLYDGEAVLGYYKPANDWPMPCLIGEDERAVAYAASSTGTVWEGEACTYKGRDLYCTKAGSHTTYDSEKGVYFPDIPNTDNIFLSESSGDRVKDIMKQSEKSDTAVATEGVLLKIAPFIGIPLGILVIVGAVIFYNKRIKDIEVIPDGPSSPRVPTQQEREDMEAMQTTNANNPTWHPDTRE